jgi:thymidylate synthase
MHITEDNIDDLLLRVVTLLRNHGKRIEPTKGPCWEYTGVLLELTDPRARFSRSESKGKLFSCLGEFLWYLSGSNDAQFIDYYIPGYASDFSDDGGKSIYGGYGPRLFNMRGVDQVKNVIQLLKRNPVSRRAVVQLFNAEDLVSRFSDIPCTCTLQFLIRDEKLILITHMRSNDAFIGLPHDIFCFTMFQELVANALSVELGSYMHLVGSLHIYEDKFDEANAFIAEGFHEKTPMPRMPPGDPWDEIAQVTDFASKIRSNDVGARDLLKISAYWETILDMLRIFHYSKPEFLNKVICNEIYSSRDWGVYSAVVRKRIEHIA